MEQDYAQAVYWYRKAAAQGNVVAQKNLGICYENGFCVKQDPKQAVEWYRKSAEQGYADAQCCLAYCYESGTGVAADQEQAVFWYLKAAMQGNARAQYNLGYLFYHSSYATEYWMRKAAEQGYESAIDWLYEEENEVPNVSPSNG